MSVNYDKRGYESSSTAHREIVGQAAFRLKRKQLLVAQQKEQLEAKFKRNMTLDYKSQVMQDANTDLKFEQRKVELYGQDIKIEEKDYN